MTESDFSIRTFTGGFDENFTYLTTCLKTGKQFIVDAALPVNKLEPFISSGLIGLFITHTHGDHIAYLNDYIRLFPDMVVMIHKNSQKKIEAPFIKPVNDGEIVTIGKLQMEPIFTPGHYPDSICFLMDNIMFTGDTLFVGRTGRTVSPGSNVRHLYQSVYSRILTLPKQTVIYPGHDYGPEPTITLENNIQLSSLLQAEDEDDFVNRMAEYEISRKITP